MNKECQIIQELIPLYGEELVSPDTAEYIDQHLENCSHCRKIWEQTSQPLQDIIDEQKWEKPQLGKGENLFAKLQKTVFLVFSIFILGGIGIVYASYNAGKNVALDDPSYRMVDELGLFTQINQIKMLDDSEINLQKGIFDNSQTVLFLTVSNPKKYPLQLRLTDNEGNEYLNRRFRVLQKKYYVAEFEPLKPGSEEVKVSINYENSPEEAEFLFPVDFGKTLQYTKIVYPNLKKEVAGLNIALKKVVLGVSQSEFKIKIDWPYDGSVSGIALGKSIYFPTSFSKVDEDSSAHPAPVAPGGLVSNYAASYGVNYRPEEPPVNRPALYDLTNREEVVIQKGEYRTTQFPCQIEGSLWFDIVEPEAEELDLLLPNIYIFQKTENTLPVELDFSKQAETSLEKLIFVAEGIIKLNKARLEDGRLLIDYQMTKKDDKQDIIPHFKLLDEKGEKQSNMHFSQKEGEGFFFIRDEGQKIYSLILDSVGQQIPRQKFSLVISED